MTRTDKGTISHAFDTMADAAGGMLASAKATATNKADASVENAAKERRL